MVRSRGRLAGHRARRWCTGSATTGLSPSADRTFGGHAGSDPEISYRKPREIETDYARDPLLSTASCLRATGAGATDILDRYDAIRRQIDEEVERLGGAPRLSSAAEIMAPLAPRHPIR